MHPPSIANEGRALPFLIAAGAALLIAPALQAQEPRDLLPADHLGHIIQSWPDAPQAEGLLSMAIADARTIRDHAEGAASNTDDLALMQEHARGVLGALDPSLVGDQPPRTSGFITSTEAIALQLQLAAEHARATPSLRTGASDAIESAENAARWSGQMIPVAEGILAAETAAEAAPLAEDLRTMARDLVAGRDVDGDGTIALEDDEGALLHIHRQMITLARAEGELESLEDLEALQRELPR